jgi:hypothetical protein
LFAWRGFSFKALLLEKKLEAEQDVLEQKEVELTELLARANLNASAVGRVRPASSSS